MTSTRSSRDAAGSVASTGAPAADAGPATNRLYGLFPFIGILLLIAAEAIQFALHGTADWQIILVMNSVTYLIGAQALGAAFGHLFYGPPIAASIGWAPSPFQWEVGGANLGIGIAGVMASSFGRQYWLAVIIMAAAFLWVAGIGHGREVVRSHNLAVSNAGPILFTDFLVPLWCLVAWMLWA